MWKCWTRGLKSTFEKNFLKITNVQSTKVTQDSRKSTCALSRLSPTISGQFNRFYCYYRTCYCGGGSREQYEKDHAKTNSCLDDVHCEWLEALQWSSILMLGWYLCQPLKYKYQQVKNANKRNEHIEKADIKILFLHFSRLICTKPLNNVLPEVKAVRDSKDDKQSYIKQTTAYLDEAQQKVLGALDNWLGTESMRKGRHKEAVQHFAQAVARHNPAALFNLAVCHEMGLGTQQDFALAAELYEKASLLGHATAMFNLGVFHVHGWGGVPTDTHRARELFKAAAELGQLDARQVLGSKLDSSADRQPTQSSTSCTSGAALISQDPYLFTADPKLEDPTGHWFQLLNIQLDDVESNLKPSGLVSVDSGVLDLSS